MVDFNIAPEFAAHLAWIRQFVADKVEAMDALFDQEHLQPWDASDAASRAVLRPLQQIVKERGLWGLHLPKSLGGPGFGNVELCYINEILGRTHWGPVVFGCQAPDSGNGEILARYGTPEQKKRFLEPLQNGEIYSSFSMTEVEGGSDPTQLRCAARLEADHWIINGEKWFTSNAHRAAFLIVLALTDPDAAKVHERFSTLIVPTDTPGIEIIRRTGLALEPYGHGGHPHVRYNNVRVPREALLGPRGQGFKVAQSRLGGGRLHHAMRTVGSTRKALDMMLERAVSRVTQGETLARKQLVQADIAQCWIEVEQLKLLVLKTAWMLDQGEEEAARIWIGACKVKCAQVAEHVVLKAMHLLGSLGLSNETPLARLFIEFPVLGMADGPTEVHQLQIGRALLKAAKPAAGRFPSDYLPDLKAQALRKLGLAQDPGLES
jgi:acyl-CoA dehydrogenase